MDPAPLTTRSCARPTSEREYTLGWTVDAQESKNQSVFARESRKRQPYISARNPLPRVDTSAKDLSVQKREGAITLLPRVRMSHSIHADAMRASNRSARLSERRQSISKAKLNIQRLFCCISDSQDCLRSDSTVVLLCIRLSGLLICFSMILRCAAIREPQHSVQPLLYIEILITLDQYRPEFQRR